MEVVVQFRMPDLLADEGRTMKIPKTLLALALCVGATGCSRINEAAMPVTDKINAAYPVSPEVRLAEERLLTLVADDGAALDDVKARVVQRMSLRALACSQNASIGRLDSVESVKKLAMDRSCFQEQDAELQRFYGIRTIGALLGKPPLRPLKPAGPIAVLPKGKLSGIYWGKLARDAGVGVLRDGSGEGAVVEMPGATLIAALPRMTMVSDHATSVSPNGRVLVFHGHGQGATFIEAESGNTLWNLETKGSPRLLAWLPEVLGFTMTGPDGDVMLADGATGSLAPHPLSLKHSAYAAHIPGKPARLLMGTARELMLVEHTRSPQGIRATSVKQYALSGSGITSGQPVPMRSGHMVVFASSRDIGWLDLDAGTSGAWRTSPLFGIPFAKLDETHLMFDSSELGRMSLKPWSFDIANGTVTPLDLGGARGMILDIGDRVGFLRRGSDAWFGDEVTTNGETQPLDKPLAAYELEVQLAKLQAQTNEDEMMASMERARAISNSERLVRVPTAPGLADVSPDAQVHIVGVYEGKRGNGSVRVTVRNSNRPVVLVLAAYEAVNWNVVNQGARISAVLLSGYTPSSVVGTGSAPVLRIGSRHAYEVGSRDYVQLRQAVMQYTGPREIRSFQGNYTGSDFSVGGQ